MSLDFRWFVMDKFQSYIDTNIATKVLKFYEEQLLNRKGKVLEVGVIQPQLLPSLMETGLRVEGLVACKQKGETKNLSATVYQADLFDFKLPSLYEALIIPFGSFLTIPERTKAIKALKCCYEHLKPDGMIMIDLFLQDEFHLNKRKVETINDQDQLLICESQVVEIDFYNQKAMYLLSFEQWEAGELLVSERKLQPFLWFGIREFKLVLERIGFTDVKISGDYRVPLENDDLSKNKIFTFEAIKKE
ncbi:MAG: class I SAM-dependent methyltransferase [Bacillota bacterium]